MRGFGSSDRLTGPLPLFAGGVSFWLKNFTMTCPDDGKWFRENKDTGKEGKTLELEYEDRGKYHCEYDDKKIYYFYVQGKGE